MLLYIAVNTTILEYNTNAACFDLKQSSSGYAKNRYCFTVWLCAFWIQYGLQCFAAVFYIHDVTYIYCAIISSFAHATHLTLLIIAQ